MRARVTDPDARLLYLVTDTALCGGPEGVVATAVAAARAGADIVQLRDHAASTRELADLATHLKAALAEYDALFVIDDRLDVALAVKADGVHLGQSDLDPVDARRIASAMGYGEFHIGWSVSTADQLDEALALPTGTINLVGIGPMRATATKPDAAAPLGVETSGQLARTARENALSHVVIGGVKAADIPHLRRCGARGVAVVSAICGQPDPGAASATLRAALDD